MCEEDTNVRQEALDGVQAGGHGSQHISKVRAAVNPHRAVVNDQEKHD